MVNLIIVTGAQAFDMVISAYNLDVNNNEVIK